MPINRYINKYTN